MARTKLQKKKAIREPNDNDTVESQSAPRQYKQMKRLMDRPKPAKVKKEDRPAELSVDAVYKKQALLARQETKKFKKRKEYLNGRKDKAKKEAENEELVDNVRFGDVVLAPPNISVLPRNRAYIQGQKPAPKVSKPEVKAPDAEEPKEIKPIHPNDEKVGIGRKLKLKDMSKSDQAALLAERQQIIDLYRSKRKY